MRAGAFSKLQQSQSDKTRNALSRLDRVGRMLPVPIANFQALATQKTRGAQISFQVLSLAGVDSFVLMRNFSRDPGSAKAIHTWPAASLKQTPEVFPVEIHFADADEQTAGKVSYYWIKAVPVSDKTNANVFLSGSQQFDASGVPTAEKLMGDFTVTQAYTPTSNPLNSTTGGAANQATVAVGSFPVQYPFGQVNYNSGSIGPLNDATTYFIYCDDPTYKGGAQTYVPSLLGPTIVANKFRLYVGKVTTPAFGAGPSGGFQCFSGNTLVQTHRGRIPISRIKRDDKILSRRGWSRVAKLLVHEFDGELRNMGDGELVTAEHRMYAFADWRPAGELFPVKVKFKGRVYNLELATTSKSDDAHCYTLGNGQIAHNFKFIP
jgi:hypothetical protein